MHTSLNGSTVLLSGATSGIGLATAQQLAAYDITLILACRNLERAEEVRADLLQRNHKLDVHVLRLDLASLNSIREFADLVLARYRRLDVLINNAGTFSMRREETADGFEKTMGTNFFGTYLLTRSLLPLIVSTPGARIVNVTSDAHYYGRLDLDDLQLKRAYDGFGAYAASKLALQFFTQELAERLSSTGVTVNSTHPGHIFTKIWDLWPQPKWNHRLILKLMQLLMADPDTGARAIVYLATADGPGTVSGKYFVKQRIKPAARQCRNRRLQKQLWQIGEQLTGCVRQGEKVTR